MVYTLEGIKETIVHKFNEIFEVVCHYENGERLGFHVTPDREVQFMFNQDGEVPLERMQQSLLIEVFFAIEMYYSSLK